MPTVDGEQPATRDGDGCWYAEVGECVCCDVCDGGVGGELEHHDDILLHLILKHQRALGKETLVRQTEKERGTERKREERRAERGGKVGVGGGNGDGGRGRDRTDGTEKEAGEVGGKGKGILVGEQGQSRYTH